VKIFAVSIRPIIPSEMSKTEKRQPDIDVESIL
jgi:hypothetical protein